MTDKQRKLIEILRLSSEYLAEKQIENPRLNAELLVGHILGMTRVQLYLNYEKPLAEEELVNIRKVLKRRTEHEPVQYITGETEFYSLKFKVNRFTLIPRPETEILVEYIINFCHKSFTDTAKIRVLDVGTGSGNIAICLAKHVQNSFITAVDIRDETLNVAVENARLNDVEPQISFSKNDIFDSYFSTKFCEKFDIIVSNPPYISKNELSKLPPDVRNYEPYIALDGGENGLRFYNHLLYISKSLINHRGIIGFEVGNEQVDNVKDIAIQNGYHEIEVIKDLSGVQRVILIRI